LRTTGTGRASGKYIGEEKCTQDFGGKSEGKSPLETARRRWVNNMKVNHQERGWKGYGLNCSGSGCG
jgi:hypothetical protein